VKTKILSGGEGVKEGESAEILVKHTPCYVGKFEKAIIVKTNKEPKTRIFVIKGEAVD